MKKSVVILIAVIYVASIAVVTFFGLKHNTFFEDVKVTDVTIVNEGIRYTKGGEKYIVLPSDRTTFQIEYTILPDNAINKKVAFIYDEQNTAATVDDNGLVTFNRSGSITVYVTATDGNGASDKIIIRRK